MKQSTSKAYVAPMLNAPIKVAKRASTASDMPMRGQRTETNKTSKSKIKMGNH